MHVPISSPTHITFPYYISTQKLRIFISSRIPLQIESGVDMEPELSKLKLNEMHLNR